MPETGQGQEDSERRPRGKGWNTALLRALSDLMFVIRRDGTYLEFKAEKEDLALPPGEIIGKNIRDVGFSRVYLERIFSHIEKAIETGEVQAFDFELAVPRGMRQWEARMTAVDEDEVLVLVRDVTDRRRAEEELRIARQEAERVAAELNAVFDSLTQPVIVFDASGKPVKANPAAHAAFGLDVTRFDADGYAEAIARFGARRLDGRPLKKDELPSRRALAGEAVRNRSYAFTNAQGKVLTFDVSSTPLFAGGRVAGSVTVWYDVTVRRQIEEALRERELMFRRLIDSNIIGIMMGAADTITEANDIVLYMLGFSREEFRAGAINLRSITPPEYGPLDDQAMEDLADYGASIPYEKEFMRRDGRRLAVLIGTALLDRAGMKWISFVLDLTERRRMEAIVKESGERLQMAISAANEAIWDWNVQDNTVRWNDTYTRLFGRPSDSASSHRWWLEHLHPEDRDRVVGSLKAALDGPDTSWTIEYRFLRLDGLWAQIYDRAYIARDASGKPRRAVGAMLDLTELKETEKALRQRTVQLERSNEELEASYRDMESFGYSVSHDLRAPLIAVNGFARLLIERYSDKLDDDARDLLERIREGGKQMERLISDILAFSRVGRLEIDKVEVDAAMMVKSVCEELQSGLAGRRNVNLEIKALPSAYGDPTALRQVFVNLISNAIKFTQTREIAAVEVGGSVEGDETVYCVRDNGVGFDMSDSGRLFDPFQRLHRAGGFAGTGIGLAIVKRIVEKHGGRVWAEGTPDRGAAFYFSLPRRSEDS